MVGLLAQASANPAEASENAPAAVAPATAYSVEMPRDASAPASTVTGYQGLASFGAALVAVPGSLALGTWLGSLSPNLYAAALPALLLVATLPPLAVTGSTYWVGEAAAPGKRKWLPALLVTTGLHLATLGVVLATGTSMGNMQHFGNLVALETLMLPTGATLAAHWTRRQPTGPASNPADATSRLDGRLNIPVLTLRF